MYRTGFWNGHSIYLVKNCFAILIRVSKFVSVEKFTFALRLRYRGVHTRQGSTSESSSWSWSSSRDKVLLQP